jgi:hypothetical protein
MPTPAACHAPERTTSRPSSSVSSYGWPKTRRSSGCCTAHTAAAAAPASAPRSVRVAVEGMGGL